MGRFVPGSPTMVVQNMPGAGGLKSANHLYVVAPKDGSTIAILHNTLTLNQIAKSASVSYDMRRFAWLGSMSITSTICAFTPKAGVSGLSDVVSKEVVIGASAGSTSMIPAILNSLVGTKFKQVKGYESTSNILVAMERGEVDGVCGWGWDSAKVQAMSALERKAFGIGLDIANEPHPDLKKLGVPFVMDLMKEGPNKQALDLILSTQYYNRPFAAPPEHARRSRRRAAQGVRGCAERQVASRRGGEGAHGHRLSLAAADRRRARQGVRRSRQRAAARHRGVEADGMGRPLAALTC